VIRRFPLATRVEEAAIDAEVELELATLDICDQVRRCGRVDADSMWETGPDGLLFEDVPAAHLYNPVRGARARVEAQAQQQAAEHERRVEAQARRRAAERARSVAEAQRLDQLKRDAESQQERIARTRREALEAHWRWQRDSARSQQKLQHDTMMAHWRAVVARNGWSEAEAATHWNDWLTGPPGFFG
jgi:hypothetical protein